MQTRLQYTAEIAHTQNIRTLKDLMALLAERGQFAKRANDARLLGNRTMSCLTEIKLASKLSEFLI